MQFVWFMSILWVRWSKNCDNLISDIQYDDSHLTSDALVFQSRHDSENVFRRLHIITITNLLAVNGKYFFKYILLYTEAWNSDRKN